METHGPMEKHWNLCQIKHNLGIKFVINSLPNRPSYNVEKEGGGEGILSKLPVE